MHEKNTNQNKNIGLYAPNVPKQGWLLWCQKEIPAVNKLDPFKNDVQMTNLYIFQGYFAIHAGTYTLCYEQVQMAASCA